MTFYQGEEGPGWGRCPECPYHSTQWTQASHATLR